MGFPKIRGTFLGVPIIRTIVFWGLYWGSLILGNYHIPSESCMHSTSETYNLNSSAQMRHKKCQALTQQGKNFRCLPTKLKAVLKAKKKYKIAGRINVQTGMLAHCSLHAFSKRTARFRSFNMIHAPPNEHENPHKSPIKVAFCWQSHLDVGKVTKTCAIIIKTHRTPGYPYPKALLHPDSHKLCHNAESFEHALKPKP